MLENGKKNVSCKAFYRITYFSWFRELVYNFSSKVAEKLIEQYFFSFDW